MDRDHAMGSYDGRKSGSEMHRVVSHAPEHNLEWLQSISRDAHMHDYVLAGGALALSSTSAEVPIMSLYSGCRDDCVYAVDFNHVANGEETPMEDG